MKEITKGSLTAGIESCQQSLDKIKDELSVIQSNPYAAPESERAYRNAIVEHEHWIAVHKLAIKGLK